jgi:hypothetical protein
VSNNREVYDHATTITGLSNLTASISNYDVLTMSKHLGECSKVTPMNPYVLSIATHHRVFAFLRGQEEPPLEGAVFASVRTHCQIPPEI